jgi:hypothetical protein
LLALFSMEITVLRQRSDLGPFALDCADLAFHCAEPSRLAQYRCEGTRCVLVWGAAGGARKLAALFPFGAPSPYRDLPLLALKSPTPLLRTGWARDAVHALLDWFREDGEGAALLEFRGLRIGGPVYRAFAEVAREREQLVFAAAAAEGSRTLLIGDGAWQELAVSTLPLLRWAKRRAASVVYQLEP